MNPSWKKHLLTVVFIILGVVLITWLAFGLYGYFTKDSKDTACETSKEQTCDRNGCVKCSADEDVICSDNLKNCYCKTKPKPVITQKRTVTRNLCAECSVGYKSEKSIRKNCWQQCGYAAPSSSSSSHSSSSSSSTVKVIIKDDDEKCTGDCNPAEDIQPNEPGKGPEPSNDTGGGCPSGNCNSVNDIQSNESGGGYEPPN